MKYGHCCLCGLMCPLADGKSTSVVFSTDCGLRQAWLAGCSAESDLPLASLATTVEAIASRLGSAKSPLIWLDAVDVNTTRAAVDLAQSLGATVHVGQSTGSEIVGRVLRSEGWIGTSLAEVAGQADLLVTLGDGILRESPLMPARFVSPASRLREAVGALRWHHISSTPGRPSLQVAGGTRDGGGPLVPTVGYWPRDQWYGRLTELQWCLRDETRSLDVSAEPSGLTAALRASRRTVWMWDVDEFHDAIDELCVRRLLGIARLLSQTGRCGLLAVDNNVGRVTASETLLWLTACHTTAHFNGSSWASLPAATGYTLEDWQREFDAILLVRSLPCTRPLPRLPSALCMLPREGAHTAYAGFRSSQNHSDYWFNEGSVAQAVEPILVSRRAAHVIRGDRAVTLVCLPEGAMYGNGAGPTVDQVLAATAADLRKASESCAAC